LQICKCVKDYKNSTTRWSFFYATFKCRTTALFCKKIIHALPSSSCCCFLCSCNWAKEKTKDGLHKSGEIVGKAGSEVADGIAKGVEESFANNVEISGALHNNGITTGRVNISGTDSATDNVISVYLIFNKKYSGKLTAKAIGKDGLEFGRTSILVTADSGDAKYVDLIFDKRTDIDRKDLLKLEISVVHISTCTLPLLSNYHIGKKNNDIVIILFFPIPASHFHWHR
jgi:hypothetical protein